MSKKPERWSYKWINRRTAAVSYEVQDNAEGAFHIRDDGHGVIEEPWNEDYAVLLTTAEADRTAETVRLLLELERARRAEKASDDYEFERALDRRERAEAAVDAAHLLEDD